MSKISADRLHDFVMAVHTFAVMNPGMGFASKFKTPGAINDVNAILDVERERNEAVKALENLCDVYNDMQDGDGNPCPDIKKTKALVKRIRAVNALRKEEG